jgi:hypothetical protein
MPSAESPMRPPREYRRHLNRLTSDV